MYKNYTFQIDSFVFINESTFNIDLYHCKCFSYNNLYYIANSMPTVIIGLKNLLMTDAKINKNYHLLEAFI